MSRVSAEERADLRRWGFRPTGVDNQWVAVLSDAAVRATLNPSLARGSWRLRVYRVNGQRQLSHGRSFPDRTLLDTNVFPNLAAAYAALVLTHGAPHGRRIRLMDTESKAPMTLPDGWYFVSAVIDTPKGTPTDLFRRAECRYAAVLQLAGGEWRAVRRGRGSRPLPPDECHEFPDIQSAVAYACLFLSGAPT